MSAGGPCNLDPHSPFGKLPAFPQLACLPPPATQHAIPLHILPQRWSAPSQASAGAQWHLPGTSPPAHWAPLHWPARHPAVWTRLSSPPGLQASLPCPSLHLATPGAHLTFPLGRVPAKAHSCNTCDCPPQCTEQGPCIRTWPSFCIKGLDLILAVHLLLSFCLVLLPLNQPARPSGPALLASRQALPPHLSWLHPTLSCPCLSLTLAGSYYLGPEFSAPALGQMAMRLCHSLRPGLAPRGTPSPPRALLGLHTHATPASPAGLLGL